MVGKDNFLGKDITVKRLDGSHIRGLCVNESDLGIMVSPKNNLEYSTKYVWIPHSQIVEVFFEEDKK